jgi:SAM-dependent methyltransferase
MTAAPPYGPEFFAEQLPSSEQSARRVLPRVVELLEPRSAVDVGCGTGVWLAEAARLGVEEYLGIDGFTPESALRIPRERFELHDLTTPLRLERRFDLVICLEVAEHLEAASAGVLVESLTGLGPAVLFSAAVPNQSGEHHVNERWQDHWAELFAARGYVAVDAVRPHVWRDEAVAWWYRQNALLYCERELVRDRPALQAERAATRDAQLAVVHPVLLGWMAHQRDLLAEEVARQPSLREVLDMLPRAARTAAERRLRGHGGN